MKRPRFDDASPRLLKLIAKGTPLLYAAKACGISRQAVYNWIELGTGDKARQPYAAFVVQYEEACGKRVSELCGWLTSAAKRDPKVAMWLLEKYAPEVFGREPAAQLTEPEPDRPGIQIKLADGVTAPFALAQSTVSVDDANREEREADLPEPAAV